MKTRMFLLLFSFVTIAAAAQSQKKTAPVPKGGVFALKPGTVAPAFSLPNENGQTITLEDFKGKVVYIDFWGVDCKPCIHAIKNSVPQLHNHYEGKDVVFINICVEGSEQRWKDLLAQTNLGGVNLFAEGWINNPVCKAYRVSPIPHYVLVDQKGKIVDDNATRPEQLDLVSGNNAIDKLLKKSTKE